jgi:hypothetical protein
MADLSKPVDFFNSIGRERTKAFDRKADFARLRRAV